MGKKRVCVKCSNAIGPEDPYVTRLMERKEEVLCMRCAEVERYQHFLETGVLTTQLTVAAALAKFYYEECSDRSRLKTPVLGPGAYERISEADARLNAAVKLFEAERWFKGGLQSWLRAQSARSFTGGDETLRQQICCIHPQAAAVYLFNTSGAEHPYALQAGVEA